MNLVPRLNKYIKQKPHPAQAAFLLLPQREILYGGAAGGGKTSAMLMAALQYADLPEYRAIIFRRTNPQLEVAGGMVERSTEWLEGTGAEFNLQSKLWTFPSGATLKLAHLQHEKDIHSHQGAEYHFVGFDELTHFTERQYRYLFSRVRRVKGSKIPLRFRNTANPGGVGHTWVKQRFVAQRAPGTFFIPAKAEDNPSLDLKSYDSSLRQLGEVDYQRLRHGNWDIEQGDIFDREWFRFCVTAPQGLRWVRFWDLATTAKQRADQTVGALCAYGPDGRLYIKDIVAGRWEWPKAKQKILDTMERDGRGVTVGVEGIAGFKAACQDLLADPRSRGYTVRTIHHVTGDKVARCGPWAAAAERKQVWLVEGHWNSAFFDEVIPFPAGKFDDRVDAVSGAVQLLGKHSTKAPAFGASRRNTVVY